MLVTRKNLAGVVEQLATGTYAVDVESTGLRVHHGDRLFSLIIASATESWYFNFQTYAGLDATWVLPRADTFTQLAPFFANPANVYFLQNAKFDMAMLAKEGVALAGKIFDTEVNARLLYNRHLSYSLGSLVKEIGLEKSDEVEDYIAAHKLFTWVKSPGKEKRAKWPHYDRVPHPIISRYGEQDGKITFALGEHQRGELQKWNVVIPGGRLARLVENEARLVKTCFRMEQTGIKIDRAYCQRAYDDALATATVAAAEFEALAGMPLLDSRITLAKAFTAAGEQYPLTEKGNPSFTDEVLEGFQTPLAKRLQEYRAATKRANTYFANYLYFADAHDRIHPNMRQAGTDTGRFSYSDPNCVSLDTEVLTKGGWRDAATYGGEEIACYDASSRGIVYQAPLGVFVSATEKGLLRVRNEHMDMLLTEDHRCLFRNRKTDVLTVKPAKSFMRDAHVLHGAAEVETRAPLFDDANWLRLCVAVQADGHYKGRQVVLCFAKERKIQRCEQLLRALSIQYKKRARAHAQANRQPTTVFTIQRGDLDFRGCLDAAKCFTWRLLELSAAERQTFLEELRHWDGCYTRAPIEYYSSQHVNVDVVQALATLAGKRALKRHYTNRAGGACYIVNVTERDYSLTTNAKSEIAPAERVWCVKVPTSFFLARRNGKTFITGNCQNIPTEDTGDYPVRRAFVPSPGFFFAMLDYDQQEFRLLLDCAGERELIRRIIEEGLDVHQATADQMGVSRGEAKTLNFGLLYGMGSEKLARDLGIPPAAAAALKDKYFEALPKVRDFIRGVTERANTRGYIFNWAGRVCHFPWGVNPRTGKKDRFAYKAPNHLIQGGSGDVMKFALNSCDAYLAGKKSRLLLTIHDEVLLEVHFSECYVVDGIRKILDTSYPHRHLPMTSSASYSLTSWADKEEIPPEVLSENWAPL